MPQISKEPKLRERLEVQASLAFWERIPDFLELLIAIFCGLFPDRFGLVFDHSVSIPCWYYLY